jgi:hypothetical protein
LFKERINGEEIIEKIKVLPEDPFTTEFLEDILDKYSYKSVVPVEDLLKLTGRATDVPRIWN